MNEFRFVVLRHDVGRQLDRTSELHFDWMFQVGDTLRTWATRPLDRFDRPIELPAEPLPNHRLVYLDYEGEVSRNRGTVARRLSGSLAVIEDKPSRFIAQLSWPAPTSPQNGFVICQRIIVDGSVVDADDSAEETCGDWSLLFSPGRYETNR